MRYFVIQENRFNKERNKSILYLAEKNVNDPESKQQFLRWYKSCHPFVSVLQMKKTFFLLSIICFCLSLSSFLKENNLSLVQDVFYQTNRFRKSQGLNELIIRNDLNKIAQRHSEDMARGRVPFGHAGFYKRDALAKKEIKQLSSFAENVAFGPTSGKQVVDMWKNSAGHRRNLLGRFKYIGIGVAKDRNGRIYYTQVFAI